MSIGTPILGTVDRDTVAATSSTPGFPATSASMGLIIAAATGSGSASIITNPSGWTLDKQNGSTGDTVAPTIFGAHKIATGSESGTQTVAHGSTISSMAIIGIDGIDTANFVQSCTLLDQSTGSTTWTLPSVTVANEGSLLLYIASANNTTSTFTPPSGWTEIEDGVTQVAGSRAWSIGYKPNVSAGASGTANLTVSNNVRGLALVYVINPASGYRFAKIDGVYVPIVRLTRNGGSWV